MRAVHCDIAADRKVVSFGFDTKEAVPLVRLIHVRTVQGLTTNDAPHSTRRQLDLGLDLAKCRCRHNLAYKIVGLGRPSTERPTSCTSAGRDRHQRATKLQPWCAYSAPRTPCRLQATVSGARPWKDSMLRPKPELLLCAWTRRHYCVRGQHQQATPFNASAVVGLWTLNSSVCNPSRCLLG